MLSVFITKKKKKKPTHTHKQKKTKNFAQGYLEQLL